METIWQLIKSLITKKRIPRWDKEIVHSVYEKKHKMIWFYKEWEKYLELLFKKSLRELVSKDSWLWQFVCENGMVKHDQYTNTVWEQIYEDERDSETYRTKYGEWSYLFRLIESSLKDESELEDFLLNSIKVD